MGNPTESGYRKEIFYRFPVPCWCFLWPRFQPPGNDHSFHLSVPGHWNEFYHQSELFTSLYCRSILSRLKLNQRCSNFLAFGLDDVQQFLGCAKLELLIYGCPPFHPFQSPSFLIHRKAYWINISQTETWPAHWPVQILQKGEVQLYSRTYHRRSRQW